MGPRREGRLRSRLDGLSPHITVSDVPMPRTAVAGRHTSAMPPANLCTTVNGAPSGICVLGQFTPDGQVLKTVDNDRISGLKIQDFPASGVFGLATDRLSVSEVTALNDGDYGIARFASTGSR